MTVPAGNLDSLQAPRDGGSPAAALPPKPLRYVARHVRYIVGGILCLVATNLLAQVIPWVVKRTIESIEMTRSASQLGWHALVIAGLALGQALMRIPSRILIFSAAREGEYELRSLLFARLCDASSTFYRRFRTGDLMSRLTSDLSSVRALFGPGVLHVVNTLFAYGLALPMMLRIDPALTVWSLLPYPVLVLGARSFARGIYARSAGLQGALAEMTATVQEDLAGVREIKLHAAEAHRSQRFASASRGCLWQAVRLARWRAGMIPFVAMGAGASLVIVLWLGGAKVIAGQLTLGDLVALDLYVGMLAWPTMSIGWILSLWQRGVVSWRRLIEISDAACPEDTSAQPSLPPPRQRHIELRRLALALDGHTVLRDVSLELPERSFCAVAGRVGCGKTALIEALARLAEVPPGVMFCGDRDVTELPLQWMRGQVAYAPQNAFLFSTTVRDNIAFGLSPAASSSPEELERRVNEAVQLAGLQPDLLAFPDGLSTIVGERGVSLSGGQRQRIALARALVADRPILLLDDSLSSVDAETERRILAGLSKLRATRTVILVSHRLSALQHADLIVVLENGQVAERGTHAELLAQSSSLYSKLYRRQLLLRELGAPL